MSNVVVNVNACGDSALPVYQSATELPIDGSVKLAFVEPSNGIYITDGQTQVHAKQSDRALLCFIGSDNAASVRTLDDGGQPVDQPIPAGWTALTTTGGVVF